MANVLHRRQFLQTTAAAGAMGTTLLGRRTAAQSTSPNEKLNLAIVGVANKGWHNVEQLTSENIAVLCDVDENYLNRAARVYPKAHRYRDFRKMLDEQHASIDAVVVSTADHTHAPATAAALSLGKAVYCEKPLTHTVHEARTVAQLAARHRVATQMGTQIHAEDNYRRVVELVQSGAVGPIREVYTWCNKGWSEGRFAEGAVPAPAHLEWDLWLGPARERPYSPNVHPANWRRFWEYGSGTLGDMGCHIMDLVFWALELRHPTRISAEGPEVHPVGAPAWTKVDYQFPANDRHSGITLHWSDGGAHHDLVEQTQDHQGNPLSSWGLGILFVGEKGMLVADYGRRQLLPQDQFQDFQAPEESIPRSIGHWQEWIQACKTHSPTTCNFDYAGALTETVLLGTVAYRSGQALQWDAQALRASNAPDAERFIRK
jgi:predicted dehydrogenase